MELPTSYLVAIILLVVVFIAVVVLLLGTGSPPVTNTLDYGSLVSCCSKFKPDCSDMTVKCDDTSTMGSLASKLGYSLDQVRNACGCENV